MTQLYFIIAHHLGDSFLRIVKAITSFSLKEEDTDVHLFGDSVLRIMKATTYVFSKRRRLMYTFSVTVSSE